MGFYDSVKEDIRDENQEEEQDGEDEKVAFDHLKKEAEDREDEEQEPSSDTDIEVLGDSEVPDQHEEETVEREQEAEDLVGEQKAGRPDPQPEPEHVEEPVASGGEETVEVLRRIENQNQEILSVLRGIKRSLE